MARLAACRGRIGVALAGARQRVVAVVFRDLEIALHRHVDQRGGEGFAVIGHAVHVAHGGGRETLGRREQRNDRAARGIAAEIATRSPENKSKQHQHAEAAPIGPALSRRNSARFSASLGGMTAPLVKPTAMVRPSSGAKRRRGVEMDGRWDPVVSSRVLACGDPAAPV